LPQIENELRILEILQQAPDTTQASLAAQLGVAVGSVNWYLKRLIRKGYIKATRMERRRLKYLVTPQGIALKARLASQYLEASLQVYRELRREAADTLSNVRAAGFGSIVIAEDGEAMEILRLTCLELGVKVHDSMSERSPTVRTDGVGYAIEW
jgi:DNA-binding MarR family transcriptional regulator